MEEKKEESGKISIEKVNLKSYRINFTKDSQEDVHLFKKLMDLSDFSTRNYGPNLTVPQIIKEAIKYFSKEQLLECQRLALRASDKIQIWCDGWNQKNKTSISQTEFCASVMPELRKKDYKELEDVAIGSDQSISK